MPGMSLAGGGVAAKKKIVGSRKGVGETAGFTEYQQQSTPFATFAYSVNCRCGLFYLALFSFQDANVSEGVG